MATINDIGVPGQPLSTPPLTEWQAAVRDKLNTAEAWQAWAPTIGGATYSTLSATYTKRGTLVTVLVKGVIAAVTGEITFSLPPGCTAHADQTGAGIGTARMVAGAVTAFGHVYMAGGNQLNVRVPGTNGQAIAIGPTVPGTWIAGNVIQFTATYRSA